MTRAGRATCAVEETLLMPHRSVLGWCDACEVPVLRQARCGLCDRPSRPIHLRGRGELRPMFQPEVRAWARRRPDLGGLLRLPADGRRVYLVNEYDNFDIPHAARIKALVAEGRETLRLDESPGGLPLAVEAGACRPYLVADLVAANVRTLRAIEDEAAFFVARCAHAYHDRPLGVSFSGGKDSMVLAGLLASGKAPPFRLFHAAGALDLPGFAPFVRAAVRKLPRELPLSVIEDPMSLEDLRRRHRRPPAKERPWCCDHDNAHLAATIRAIFGTHRILAFTGDRGYEYARSYRMRRVARYSGIPEQLIAKPLLAWSALEVWLYLFWKGLPINPVYRWGLARTAHFNCYRNPPMDRRIIVEHHPELAAQRAIFAVGLERWGTAAGQRARRRVASRPHVL